MTALRSDRLRLAKLEAMGVPPGQEQVLFASNNDGPGEIQSIWMAVGGGGAPALDGRLRVYYDSATDATMRKAIDIDLGTLLATHWGANGPHQCGHVSVDIGGGFTTGFLLSFPMPFNPNIKITYYNINAGQPASIYSMVAYRILRQDVSGGMRLRCQGARFADQKVTRNPWDVTTLASVTGSGSIVYHSQVGGVWANNLTWMERNISLSIDGDTTPSIMSSGTEDWFDSAWYFQGRRDYSTSIHSYVGTDKPSNNVYTVGMATDLMSKWDGIPFMQSVVMKAETEPNVTTPDTLSWAVLYYLQG